MRIKIIYWLVALAPLVFINLSPYLGISFPETIDNDEIYHKLVFWLSLLFILFLLGTFASYKCVVYSEIIVTKIIASLFLLLYLIVVGVMVYLVVNGFIGAQ